MNITSSNQDTTLSRFHIGVLRLGYFVDIPGINVNIGFRSYNSYISTKKKWIVLFVLVVVG